MKLPPEFALKEKCSKLFAEINDSITMIVADLEEEKCKLKELNEAT